MTTDEVEQLQRELVAAQDQIFKLHAALVERNERLKRWESNVGRLIAAASGLVGVLLAVLIVWGIWT